MFFFYFIHSDVSSDKSEKMVSLCVYMFSLSFFSKSTRLCAHTVKRYTFTSN